MFTGIIQSVSPVLSTLSRGDSRLVRIEKPKNWRLQPGQSVAVDGVCSTVTSAGKNFFEVEYMPETLRKTRLGALAEGVRVNLERPLTLQSFIEGHLVQGHVDAATELLRTEKKGAEHLLTFSLPNSLKKYVVLHGSIAVNGVSLTVARKRGLTFTVGLIPYTLKHTNLGRLKKGERANIEIDMLGRYLEGLYH